MPGPGTWPRDDLIAMLGQPNSEKTQISISQDLPEGQSISSVEVDSNTIGATRLMSWACSCIATSEVTGGDDDRWDVFLTCRRHRQAGLKGRFDDAVGGVS